MRYFVAFEFDGNAKVFFALAEAIELREVSLIYSFEESVSPHKEHFQPLTSLSNLNALAITSLQFEEPLRDSIGASLGVKVSNWIANSAGDSFLRELETTL